MCEFCKRFDFSTVSAMTDKYGARIASGMGNSEFPVEQQFNFCPVCGEKIKDNVVSLKWISLKEQYPPKDIGVLIYRGNFIGDLMDVFYYDGGDTWEDCYGYSGTTEGEGITHWMPLPEPPKEI